MISLTYATARSLDGGMRESTMMASPWCLTIARAPWPTFTVMIFISLPLFSAVQRLIEIAFQMQNGVPRRAEFPFLVVPQDVRDDWVRGGGGDRIGPRLVVGIFHRDHHGARIIHERQGSLPVRGADVFREKGLQAGI